MYLTENNFAQWVAYWRKAIGSRAKLANMAGVSQGLIAKAEHGGNVLVPFQEFIKKAIREFQFSTEGKLRATTSLQESTSNGKLPATTPPLQSGRQKIHPSEATPMQRLEALQKQNEAILAAVTKNSELIEKLMSDLRGSTRQAEPHISTARKAQGKAG